MASSDDLPQGDDLNYVKSLLQAAAAGPAACVKMGSPPMPQIIDILPNNPQDDNGQMQSYYQALQQMSAVSALYTAVYVVEAYKSKGRSVPYNVNNAAEAEQAFADQAASAYQVMQSAFAQFYSMNPAVRKTYEKTMAKSDIHAEFFKELFTSYNLEPTAFQQLDGVLQTFVQAVQNIGIDPSNPGATVDFTLRINQVTQTNLGEDDCPVWISNAMTRVVCLHISSKTWTAAISKDDPDQQLTFKMETMSVDAELNFDQFQQFKPRVEQAFQSAMNMSLQDFADKICPAPVNSV
jgi:hypothetical protein